jgi:predicted RNA-binding protein (virulence factor B family)
MMWKGCEMKRLWPNLGYYPSMCVVRLRKTTEDLRIFGIPAGIQTRHFPNKIKKRYCLSKHSWYKQCGNIEKMKKIVSEEKFRIWL